MATSNRVSLDTNVINLRTMFAFSTANVPISTNYIQTTGPNGLFQWTDALQNLSSYGVNLPSSMTAVSTAIYQTSNAITAPARIYASIELLNVLSNYTHAAISTTALHAVSQLSSFSTSIADLLSTYMYYSTATLATPANLRQATATVQAAIEPSYKREGVYMSTISATTAADTAGISTTLNNFSTNYATLSSITTATYASQSTAVASIQAAPSSIASQLSSLTSTQYGQITQVSSLLSTMSNFFATQTFGPQYSTLSTSITGTLSTVSASIYVQQAYYSTLSSYTANSTITAAQISSFAAADLIPPGYRPTKDFLMLAETAPGNYLVIPDISAISTGISRADLVMRETTGFVSRQDIIGTTDQILIFGSDRINNLTTFDPLSLQTTANYYAPIGSQGAFHTAIYHPRYHYVLVGTNSQIPTQTLVQFVETDPYRISLFNAGQYISDTRAIAQSPSGDIIIGGTDGGGRPVVGYNPSTDPDLIFETFTFYTSQTALPPNGITSLAYSQGRWIAGGRGRPTEVISQMSDISGRNLDRWTRADVSGQLQDISSISYAISDIIWSVEQGQWIAAAAAAQAPLLIYTSPNGISWTATKTSLSGEDLATGSFDPLKIHLYESGQQIFLQTQAGLYEGSGATWRRAIPAQTLQYNSMIGALIPANTIEYNTLYLQKELANNQALYIQTSTAVQTDCATKDNISSLSTQLARGTDGITQATLSTLGTALSNLSQYRVNTAQSFNMAYTTRDDLAALSTTYSTILNPELSTLSSYFAASVKSSDLSTLSTYFSGRVDPQTTTTQLISTTAGIYAHPVYSTIQAPRAQIANLTLTPQSITDPITLQVQAPKFYINSNVDPSATTLSYINRTTQMNTNFVIDGYLSKEAGTFNISHPDPQMAAQGYRLRHSFVEAPTRGENIYRAAATTVAGQATIPLPSYFASLNEAPQAWVQPQGFAQAHAVVSPCNTYLTVYTSTDCEVAIMVIATRKDPAAIRGFDDRGGVYFSR